MIGAQERHAEPSHEASQARSRLATHPAVLWQFRNSHFNEKVRWALDWKRVPHLRRSLVPGLHIGRALWMTGKKQVRRSTRATPPIADARSSSRISSTRSWARTFAARSSTRCFPTPTSRARS